MTAVVDYTSMTRVWYASVLRFFADTKNSLEEVTLYFTYTAARFSKRAVSLVQPPCEPDSAGNAVQLAHGNSVFGQENVRPNHPRQLVLEGR